MVKDILLQLVRCAITGQAEKIKLPLGVSWKSVYTLAGRSGVTSLAWHGVEITYAAGTLTMPREVKMRWYAANESHIKAMAQRRAVAEDFAQKLHPLPCIVLKGIDYARYWPNPLWREYCDLDVWFGDYFDEANKRAIALGADFDAHDYKHSHITYRGMMVENHRYLTYFGGTKQGRRTEIHLESILSQKDFEPIGNTYLLSPPAEFSLIYFLRHALQHFLSEGIALRYVLDWYFLLRGQSSVAKSEQFIATLRNLGLLPFAALLTDYLREIGLPTNIILPITTSRQLLSLFERDLYTESIAPTSKSFIGRFKHKLSFIRHTWRFRKALNESFVARTWGLIAYSKVFRKKAEL